MELLDIYDRDRVLTGATFPRGGAHPVGGYHLVMHVCVFNAKGELLIQRRSPDKKLWGGLWDLSVAGCVRAGETSREAAERELMEELGLAVDMGDARPLMTVNFDRGYDDFFAVTRDVDMASLRLDPAEVTDAAFAGSERVVEMLDRSLFVPYRESFVKLLFEMRTDGLLFSR